MDINTSKSYATKENLVKALIKLDFANDRYVVVCNEAGRFTAIFPLSNIQDGNVCRYANLGFMTLG